MLAACWACNSKRMHAVYRALCFGSALREARVSRTVPFSGREVCPLCRFLPHIADAGKPHLLRTAPRSHAAEVVGCELVCRELELCRLPHAGCWQWRISEGRRGWVPALWLAEAILAEAAIRRPRRSPQRRPRDRSDPLACSLAHLHEDGSAIVRARRCRALVRLAAFGIAVRPAELP